tara:strand:+ start:869 stop:1714 length:846 start_codon:yes stop_codon:yes gene_type:complete
LKTILYATDYSDNSIAALRQAQFWSELMNASLIVLHVFDVPISVASPVTLAYTQKEKRLFTEHHAKLKTFCWKHLDTYLHKTKIRFEVVENGMADDAIVEQAVELNADLIVVGTKGSSALKEFILGSTAKGLIGKAPCPVLVVPEGCDNTQMKTIVYATDFEGADIFAIRRLAKIAKALDATIKVVHISTKAEYAGDQQFQWFKDMVGQKIKYDKIEFFMIYSESVYEELLEFMVDSEADMLAMLERGQKGIMAKLFHRDLVKKMESGIGIPFLSFAVEGL